MSVYDNSQNEIDLEAKKELQIPFWGTDPNILLQNLNELFPVEAMTYEQKLNSITRLVIILTIASFLFSRSMRVLIIGILTVVFVYVIHYYQNKMLEEGFDSATDKLVSHYEIPTDDVFDEPTSSNPFGNVLVTDIEYNPDKKPAPPAFNSDINDKIMNETKQMVQEMNPDQPNIDDKLFKDLGEQLTFEQSLRQFNSNPNTSVVNDQTGFAEFCYGNMVSCKEGNLFACAKNMSNYNLY